MITKEILKNIVIKQKDQGFSIDGTIKRSILEEILKWFDDDRVIILTGLRRSGKSTLLKQIMHEKDSFCYVNFEDERFLDFKAQDFEILNEILIEIYGGIDIYFFDEVQVIDKFETFVRRLQDEGKKVIITGSNASLLSKEFGTKLTGRYKAFEVYPFSFKEFLDFKEFEYDERSFYITEKKAKIKRLFQEYLKIGGLPEYLKNEDLEYMRDVYENILYKDIIVRYGIKKEKTIKELVSLLITNLSSAFTYNSLRKVLKLGNAITVKEYVSYLSNSYLLFELTKFDYSLKKQFDFEKKIYLIDSAFYQVGGLNFSPNSGKILENLVFIELKRRGSEVFYYSDKNECDFVIKEKTKIGQVIQVCYEFNEKNKSREIDGLIESMNKFKLKKGLILTYDQEDEFDINGKKIFLLPVWKWLLN